MFMTPNMLQATSALEDKFINKFKGESPKGFLVFLIANNDNYDYFHFSLSSDKVIKDKGYYALNQHVYGSDGCPDTMVGCCLVLDTKPEDGNYSEEFIIKNRKVLFNGNSENLINETLNVFDYEGFFGFGGLKDEKIINISPSKLRAKVSYFLLNDDYLSKTYLYKNLKGKIDFTIRQEITSPNNLFNMYPAISNSGYSSLPIIFTMDRGGIYKVNHYELEGYPTNENFNDVYVNKIFNMESYNSYIEEIYEGTDLINSIQQLSFKASDFKNEPRKLPLIYTGHDPNNYDKQVYFLSTGLLIGLKDTKYNFSNIGYLVELIYKKLNPKFSHKTIKRSFNIKELYAYNSNSYGQAINSSVGGISKKENQFWAIPDKGYILSENFVPNTTDFVYLNQTNCKIFFLNKKIYEPGWIGSSGQIEFIRHSVGKIPALYEEEHGCDTSFSYKGVEISITPSVVKGSDGLWYVRIDLIQTKTTNCYGYVGFTLEFSWNFT